ncbi:PREDICTED: NADH dehydrogenase [ubiquinone] 1 beta subcomplex subunit 8, mitochondrial [Nicrophorus vespilloides]|uniref:NADH dehydrogenase [ubiquinone] 1 beta subcomplex subunit 8, mitochondrial n=1 Tax=Nicrophorus vespilloides TaxID=110193 RepID=A0ABM1NCI4_NICVS|nr:PREDICTED: NADH dehydrogenase [ubiquinone] 1 beta subcomplex subunit 8, mitochondrial [Nicrophorus vespilloides]
MSLVNTSRKFAQICATKNPILFTAIRNHWNKDFKPAAFPKTQEERNAAAEKYGLISSEYKPYANDGTGMGDYPELPLTSGDSRDPHYPWDNPELKRNFNEPLHADFEMYGEDRYDVMFKHRTPVYKQFFQFTGVMLGIFIVYGVCENFKMFPGLIPKQYPLQGKKHYTFEVEE